jgi:hypothetical protein
MKYLKEYNEYKNGIDVEDIEDCFRDLIDKGIYVKISIPRVSSLGFGGVRRMTKLSTFDKVFAVSLNLDQFTQPFGQNDMTDQALSEYGVRYRAVVDGKEISELIAESISKCEGVLDLEIVRAEMKWVNAGEWTHFKKKKTELRLNNWIKSNPSATPEEIESIKNDLEIAQPSGLGPGMLERTYTKDCNKKLSDSDAGLETKLSTSELDEDIIRKGDRLRNIFVYFIEKR